MTGQIPFNEHDRKLTLSPLALTHSEFAAISALAHEEFGVELGSGKEQLVAARIGKLMRRLSFSSFREFYDHLQADRTGQCLTQLIDSLTTNHTSFFREQAHFDFLVEQIFQNWQCTRPMRIWSAACSTGEEPYTIALIANEFFKTRCKSTPCILASDISTHALETARKGAYPRNGSSRHSLRGCGNTFCAARVTGMAGTGCDQKSWTWSNTAASISITPSPTSADSM